MKISKLCARRVDNDVDVGLWVIRFSIAAILLCGSSYASPAQTQDTGVIDEFISKQAARENGEEYADARKVLAGDLNRDGVPDLAVLYTIESQNGSNNYTQYLAVFIRSRRGVIPAAHTVVGGKLNRAVELESIKNNVIFFKTQSYGPKDAACCPSRKGTTRFMLVKHRLREL
jgi:hypothetical protein